VAQAIAICDSCGFVIGAVGIENGSNAQSGFDPRERLACPVPGCGGSGTSLDRGNGAAADALATLCNVPVSRQQWAGLADILERAQAEGLPGSKIAAEIERKLPAGMNSVAAEFRRMSSKAAAAALTDSLYAAIADLAAPSNATAEGSLRQSQPERSAFLKPAPHDHDHAGHNCAGHAHPHSRPHTNPHKKIGRNEPCWCGSGQKYKRCHGAHP
jgi:hypothetical protein